MATAKDYENKELDMSKITPEQGVKLAGRGRADRSNPRGLRGQSGIGQGTTGEDTGMLGVAGSKFAEQPLIPVTNVQRSKTKKLDPRSYGGRTFEELASKIASGSRPGDAKGMRINKTEGGSSETASGGDENVERKMSALNSMTQEDAGLMANFAGYTALGLGVGAALGVPSTDLAAFVAQTVSNPSNMAKGMSLSALSGIENIGKSIANVMDLATDKQVNTAKEMAKGTGTISDLEQVALGKAQPGVVAKEKAKEKLRQSADKSAKGMTTYDLQATAATMGTIADTPVNVKSAQEELGRRKAGGGESEIDNIGGIDVSGHTAAQRSPQAIDAANIEYGFDYDSSDQESNTDSGGGRGGGTETESDPSGGMGGY